MIVWVLVILCAKTGNPTVDHIVIGNKAMCENAGVAVRKASSLTKTLGDRERCEVLCVQTQEGL